MRNKDTAVSGMVTCLGWCNKIFKSKDRFNIRFCKKCAQRRQAELSRNVKNPKHCALELSDDI